MIAPAQPATRIADDKIEFHRTKFFNRTAQSKMTAQSNARAKIRDAARGEAASHLRPARGKSVVARPATLLRDSFRDSFGRAFGSVARRH
jgi:hypothetical protein